MADVVQNPVPVQVPVQVVQPVVNPFLVQALEALITGHPAHTHLPEEAHVEYWKKYDVLFNLLKAVIPDPAHFKQITDRLDALKAKTAAKVAAGEDLTVKADSLKTLVELLFNPNYRYPTVPIADLEFIPRAEDISAFADRVRATTNDLVTLHNFQPELDYMDYVKNQTQATNADVTKLLDVFVFIFRRLNPRRIAEMEEALPHTMRFQGDASTFLAAVLYFIYRNLASLFVDINNHNLRYFGSGNTDATIQYARIKFAEQYPFAPKTQGFLEDMFLECGFYGINKGVNKPGRWKLYHNSFLVDALFDNTLPLPETLCFLKKYFQQVQTDVASFVSASADLYTKVSKELASALRMELDHLVDRSIEAPSSYLLTLSPQCLNLYHGIVRGLSRFATVHYQVFETTFKENLQHAASSRIAHAYRSKKYKAFKVISASSLKLFSLELSQKLR